MPDSKLDERWQKLQILLDPIGKAITAMLVVVLGYFANDALQNDQKRRAYVELLSQREQADGTLRKDMFSKVIDTFIKDGGTTLENRILNLELLAYNFHESIDLGPLLKQIYLQALEEDQTTSRQRKRIQNLAQEIVGREFVSLSKAGCSGYGEVKFAELEKDNMKSGFIELDCPARPKLPATHFVADVMTRPGVTDLRRQTEVDVVLNVRPLDPKAPLEERQAFEFTVSPFDFPMIDNVRLGESGGRVSMVMTRIDDGGITLSLVYFPDSRTSLKDRPFHDEVLKALEEP